MRRTAMLIAITLSLACAEAQPASCTASSPPDPYDACPTWGKTGDDGVYPDPECNDCDEPSNEPRPNWYNAQQPIACSSFTVECKNCTNNHVDYTCPGGSTALTTKIYCYCIPAPASTGLCDHYIPSHAYTVYIEQQVCDGLGNCTRPGTLWYVTVLRPACGTKQCDSTPPPSCE
jgi:hypothetical protein